MDQPVGIGGVGRQADRERRRLFQLLLVAAIFHHMHKGGHRTFRGAVGRNTGLGKQSSGFLRRVFAAPVGEQRDAFTARVLANRIDNAFGGGGARCRRTWGVDQ
ncbi:hypothetical protein D1872_286400 [compost metagenome]